MGSTRPDRTFPGQASELGKSGYVNTPQGQYAVANQVPCLPGPGTSRYQKSGSQSAAGTRGARRGGRERVVGLSGRIFPPTALIADKHCEPSVRQGASPQVARSGMGSPLNRSCAGQRPAARVGVAGPTPGLTCGFCSVGCRFTPVKWRAQTVITRGSRSAAHVLGQQVSDQRERCLPLILGEIVPGPEAAGARAREEPCGLAPRAGSASGHSRRRAAPRTGGAHSVEPVHQAARAGRRPPANTAVGRARAPISATGSPSTTSRSAS